MKFPAQARASFIAVLLCVAPFFVLPIPPMSDLSDHVLVARILAQYHNPTLGFDKYFSVHWELHSGIATYALLSAMQSVASPFVGARVYLVTWVVALWASVYFLARCCGSKAPWAAALAALPLTFGWYVYTGLLPFIATIPLFALIVGFWNAEIPSRIKIPLVACFLCVSFLFHVVGAGAAVVALCVSYICTRFTGDAHPGKWWHLALSIAPVTLLTVNFLYGSHRPHAVVHWTSPLANIKPCISFTVGALSTVAAILLLLWLLGLAAALLVRGRLWSRSSHVLVVPALVLAGIACVLPVTFGSLWPAGPRLLPFALLLLIAAVAWEAIQVRLLVSGMLALIVGLSASTSFKAAALRSDFDDFLSGREFVTSGARLLPILVNPNEGSHWVQPFWSLASAYTITSGGENPYVFADPFVQTAASPLRYRAPETTRQFASLLGKPMEPAEYRGVSRSYDYVLVWGLWPQLEAVLADEMTLLHRQGRLVIYGSRPGDAAQPRRLIEGATPETLLQ